jgi:signal transduction histidine kinase
MRTTQLDAGYGQMRWVALLLVIAVVLPTVCLLWFMAQIVKNEQLASQQKLITFYRSQLDRAISRTNQGWSAARKLLDQADATIHPYLRFRTQPATDKDCAALVLYDATGNRVYPVLRADWPDSQVSSGVLEEPYRLEFIDRNYAKAADLYENLSNFGSDHTKLAAITGKSRCLAKLGRLQQAIDECKLAAFSPLDQTGDSALLVVIANARLFLLRLAEGRSEFSDVFEQVFNLLVSMVYSVNSAGAALPADQNLFLAQKALEIGQKHLLFRDQASITQLMQMMGIEERSIAAAEQYPIAGAIEGWHRDRVRRVRLLDQTFYGFSHNYAGASMLVLFSEKGLASMVSEHHSDFEDSFVRYRIVDDTGVFVSGTEEPTGEPFATGSVGDHLPGWRIELYFKGSEVFERAANERAAVYIWTGMLVIALILVVGAFAGRALSRQVKLNRLKNDFIATVSHELKTPLASMRVLVDTLLEGHYKDQQQVGDYLQLISNENARLSRLIDNFLTFSRMERNKRAFVFAPMAPAAIAHGAVEAVKTKFSNGHAQTAVKFEVQIADDLPQVQADRDAMVTVLLNLLDNACKYSGDDKQIRLTVFKQNDSVCFSVSDNGIGMPRRALRKIFRRFYQVDRSLSRRAGGCGLGLSIAKFIVDAHRGSIRVESKIGQGSTFTVALPALKRPNELVGQTSNRKD